MCQFILLVFNRGATHGDLESPARRQKFGWRPVPAGLLSGDVRPDDQVVCVTRGSCDCGSPLGAAAGRGGLARDAQDEAEKLRRKGWSEAKISRALAARSSSSQFKAESVSRAGAGNVEFQRWIAFLGEALHEGAASAVGFVLHFYRSGPEDEPIRIARRSFRLSALDSDLLLNAEQDTLYEFRT